MCGGFMFLYIISKFFNNLKTKTILGAKTGIVHASDSCFLYENIEKELV